MTCWPGIISTALLLAACSGTDPRTNRAPVTRADFGDRWPFTIDGGTLVCARESARSGRLLVTLDNGRGISFGLNGSAREFGFPDSASILRPGLTRAAAQPLIDRGLTLCPRE